MTAEWDDLARLAERATPGEWTTYAAYGSRGVEVVDTEDMLFIQDGGVTYAVNEADAEFIAAANPATILRLIAENRDLSERLALAYRDEVLAHDERDALAARLAAVEAAIRDHALELFSPALRIEAVPVDRLRAALSAAPTDTTKEN